MEIVLISRRSQKRGGTRYNARGVDDDGRVANFVETEQLVCFRGVVTSHVQIRGSVPLFWEQKGFTAVARLTRSSEMNTTAFLKHFYRLKHKYNKCMCLNLLARNKVQEQQLTQEFEALVQQNQNRLKDFLKYDYFDYHQEVKDSRHSGVNALVNKYKDLIQYAFRFYAKKRNAKEVISQQKGVIRVNCLDCLDRTNVLMFKIGLVVLELVMRQMNI